MTELNRPTAPGTASSGTASPPPATPATVSTTPRAASAPPATSLTDKHCQPCEGGVPPYTVEQARAALAQLSGEWHLVEEGNAIRREFGFRNFYHTMSFVNALAHLANVEDHHPDLEVGYSYCRVRFSTHAIGGLSENDFICAAKLDRIPQR